MTHETKDLGAKAAKKQKSHEAILASAAALLRSRGIGASSVADVMKGAGLTVGGFYGHFESKEDLFAKTIRTTAHALWDEMLATTQGLPGPVRVVAVARRYLSRAHRDHPEAGCVLPNVASEVARDGEPYRSALAAEVEGFVQSLATMLETEASPAAARDRALAVFALMYGGLSLSRVLGPGPLSDAVLAAARRGAAILVQDGVGGKGVRY